MPSVAHALLAHIAASKNVAHIQPIFAEFTVLFLRGRTNSQFDLFLNYSPLARLGEQIM